ncbi:MAG: RodZ domain-containing protein [Steroidobacteraceae bacterium]
MSGPAEKTAAASVGERLRAARDRQGLTLQKISEDLHLDVPMLEAMEENRFRALGAPVYARGHLRKYAELLGLDVSGVLADYEAAHSGPVEPKLVPSITEHPAMPPIRTAGGLRWAITGAIVGVVFVLAVAAWWYVGPHRLAKPVAAPAVQQMVVAPAPARPEPTVETRPIEPAKAKPPEATTRKAPTVPRRVMTPVPAGGTARLGLRFVSPSWVEIYDASGARLLFDERDAASARTVVGVPPFKVLLGNFDGVELTLNGRAVQIPQRARYGATARFRVMADGAALSSWGAE